MTASILKLLETEQDRGNPLLKSSQAVGDYLPVVHCFEFRGNHYAYFVRTGDLLRVNPLAYEALSGIERGSPTERVKQDLLYRHPADELAPVLQDLEALEQAGYLTPEVNLSDEALAQRCDSYLAHRPRNIMFFVTAACNLAC